MHHHRIRRHGSPDVNLRPPAQRRVGPNGYIMTPAPKGHPLQVGTGRRSVLEHRLVLFDAIGAGPHRCHYCGVEIWWFPPTHEHIPLTVDHVDFDHANNDLANLVPSCQPCNIGRTGGDAHHSSKRSQCREGHELTGDNIVPGTVARCATCMAASQRKAIERRRAAREQETMTR